MSKLAFYKKSKTPWTLQEYNAVMKHVNDAPIADESEWSAIGGFDGVTNPIYGGVGDTYHWWSIQTTKSLVAMGYTLVEYEELFEPKVNFTELEESLYGHKI